MRLACLLVGLLIAASLGSVTSASAQAYRAVNQLLVYPLNPSDFEVIEARGEGARGMWCAASDYARARYGQGVRGRLYVKKPRGVSQTRPGRKGVVFTIDETTLPVPPSQSLSVTVRTVGVGLPVNHAHQFCKDYLLELEDIFYRRRR